MSWLSSRHDWYFNPNVGSSRVKNLNSNVHFSIGRKPIHKVSHFHFGVFGSANTHFDLFILLPTINLGQKSLTNHVPNSILKAWADEVVIKAIEKVIPSGLRSQWPSSWDIKLANCEAVQELEKLQPAGEEKQEGSKLRQIYQTLPRRYVSPFWKECRQLLNRAITAEHPELRYFRGFKLFCKLFGKKPEGSNLWREWRFEKVGKDY